MPTASGDAVEEPKPFVPVFVVMNNVRAIDFVIQDVIDASWNFNAEILRYVPSGKDCVLIFAQVICLSSWMSAPSNQPSRRYFPMAIDASPSKRELRNVVAPSSLMDPVSEVLAGLDARFLLESARLAMARPISGAKWIVKREDVLNAARDVLAEAASEIAKALSTNESEQVRRKAS